MPTQTIPILILPVSRGEVYGTDEQPSTDNLALLKDPSIPWGAYAGKTGYLLCRNCPLPANLLGASYWVQVTRRVPVCEGCLQRLWLPGQAYAATGRKSHGVFYISALFEDSIDLQMRINVAVLPNSSQYAPHGASRGENSGAAQSNDNNDEPIDASTQSNQIQTSAPTFSNILNSTAPSSGTAPIISNLLNPTTPSPKPEAGSEPN